MGSRALKRTVAVAGCTVAMMSVGWGAAQAGEITGNGKHMFPPHTHPCASICAFSGQNDEFHELGPEFPRVQSFGQIVAEVGPLGGVPGTECNPTRALPE
jgi:hypothetical protein